MRRNFVGQGSGYLHGDIKKKMERMEQSTRLTGYGVEWNKIIAFLSEPAQADIRKNICYGCGHARLYDKNDKQYYINGRLLKLDDVKNIVAEIKLINQNKES